MTTYRNGFFSKMGKKIIRFLNYNAKKALNIYIGVLSLLAIANVAYIGFLANITRITFRNFLDKNPLNTVMLIISILDVIFAYILWMERSTLLNNQKRFQGMIVYLSVLQLFVGNLVCFVLGMITLFTGNEISQTGNHYFEKNEIIPLTIGAILYIFCTMLLLIVEL